MPLASLAPTGLSERGSTPTSARELREHFVASTSSMTAPTSHNLSAKFERKNCGIYAHRRSNKKFLSGRLYERAAANSRECRLCSSIARQEEVVEEKEEEHHKEQLVTVLFWDYLRLLSYLSAWYFFTTIINGFVRKRLCRQFSTTPLSLRILPIFLFLIISLIARPLSAEIKNLDAESPMISTLENDKSEKFNSNKRLTKYQYSTVREEPISFDQWINQTQGKNGIFLNHSSYSEGEVLLFRTKKSRHRAIAVMNVASFSSKFSDALTFKEWLKTVYSQNKALKLSVRTTEVVRPVLQHLYASTSGFRAPIIIHANTFANSGRRVGPAGVYEKPVDAVVFINSVSEYLPEAVISLGWTQSSDYAALNRLDWRQTFRLIDYIHRLQQPIILNMKLNDALHSLTQLEWLLGVESLSIFVVLHGDVSDFIESDSLLRRLAELSASSSAHKILFDVDETWRRRLESATPQHKSQRKEKRSVEPERWTNLVFANSHEILSASLVSSRGVAFLGWPNSLFVSNRPSADYPTKQRIAGRVMFLPKREKKGVLVGKDSGMTIQLFDGPIELIESATPLIRNAIRIFIGYNGRVTIENTNRFNDASDSQPYRKKRRNRNASLSYEHNNNQYYYYSYYHKSSVGQLPQHACYDFEIVDRNWRVELDVKSAHCNSDEEDDAATTADTEESTNKSGGNYQLYLQLDAPVTRSRKTRKVAIGKSGDGVVDFIFHNIQHSSRAITVSSASLTVVFVGAALQRLLCLRFFYFTKF